MLRSVPRLALLLLALLPSAARAASSDEDIAKAHFETGLLYYDSGRFQPAAQEFLEAYRISQRPALLYNLGRTYERLGDPGRALTYYRRYLAIGSPSPDERAEIASKLAALEAQVATVTVRSKVAGTLIVDGEAVGVLPIDPLSLSAGAHTLVLRHEGFVDAERAITARGGERLTIELAPTPPLSQWPEAPPPRRRWVWPLVGVGAAVVVAAAVTTILIFTLSHDFAADGRASCTGACVLFE